MAGKPKKGAGSTPSLRAKYVPPRPPPKPPELPRAKALGPAKSKPGHPDWSQYCAAIERAVLAGTSTEHTHRPALKVLVESMEANLTATNEPSRVACGAPDFLVSRGAAPIGYIETKDVGESLQKAEGSEQIKRYCEGLDNLLLTDYLEFRWYLRGEQKMVVRLATPSRDGKLRPTQGAISQVSEMFAAFLAADAPTIRSAKDLAIRMGGLARLLRDILLRAVSSGATGSALREQMAAFRKVLLHTMTEEQFADMYAQTVSYGLFAARCNVPSGAEFTREHAPYDLPKTNPFLRKLFSHLAGPDLDDRISWAVDDLTQLLQRADFDTILRDFGKRTRREDPVIHFYETFLHAYDPTMREARGVYYTPEPVVSYIVRSVDRLLTNEFHLSSGLADTTTLPAKLQRGSMKHRVLILDPAVGTGTFLSAVIRRIRETFQGNEGMWSSYVSEHLLPRIFGFELLMAPYSVAHMKLGLLLTQTGYDFRANERLSVFLTNALEEAHETTGLPLFSQWLAEEANAASEVKQNAPVMVIVGNPPYSGHSENRGSWIRDLVADYKRGCPELSKPGGSKWLQNDYIKFIRFAQDKIERTGAGIVGFITDHSYLDGPTFRGMRQSLMGAFDEIYLVNLHGNAKRSERAPDGSKDDNVFDIEQGTVIALLVRAPSQAPSRTRTARIYYKDLWGSRESKYAWLSAHVHDDTDWKELKPAAPAHLFLPTSAKGVPEYERGWSVPDIFAVNGDPAPGLLTTHDRFAISWSRDEAIEKVEKLLSTATEGEARAHFKRLCTQDQWQYERAKSELGAENATWRSELTQVLYRPFDKRWTVFNKNVAVHRRERVTKHMLAGPNIALLTSRQTKGETFKHALVTRTISEVICLSPKTSNNAFVFPLYLYPEADIAPEQESVGGPLFRWSESRGPAARRANLAPEFLADVAQRLRMTFGGNDRCEAGEGRFGAQDVFDYIVAILHSPTYRNRFEDPLKTSFPRIPVTSRPALFETLCRLGRQVVECQLFETSLPLITTYPITGDNVVNRVEFEATSGSLRGRIWVNGSQYVDGVPKAVWEFEVGGYQVCEKWLWDRQRAKRQLTYDDLTHYQTMIASLAQTVGLMVDIDRAIAKHGGYPIE